MTVKGKTIYHCHGKDKGKKLATYKTEKVAKAIHRKIMAKKKGA
jgi:hypothetical protein